MMKKLFVIVIGAAMLLMPFADYSEARGGRSRGISGGRSRYRRRSSDKNKADQAKQDQAERGDSMLDGKLRRRSR
jgi:hypothetical protein